MTKEEREKMRAYLMGLPGGAFSGEITVSRNLLRQLLNLADDQENAIGLYKQRAQFAIQSLEKITK